MKAKWLWVFLVVCLIFAGCAPQGGQGMSSGETSRPTDESLQTTEGTPWYEEEVVWYALGDSITQGYYSYLSGGEGKLGLNAEECWAEHVARINSWELTNYGVGGSGFVHPGTVLNKLNARDHVDTIDFSGADLVTLAYGVNDWKYDMPLGTMEDDVSIGGTFYSNMRYCIEKILDDNPDVRLVVISPINCWRYGTKEGDWGIGYAFENNGTLEDIFRAMKQICEHYNVPLVDILHDSVVTTKNAMIVLPDGVHPSLAIHKKLGKELAELLKAV